MKNYSHISFNHSNNNPQPNTVRLTDTASPIFTSRWKKLPHECITVDELKFYRRRKPSGILSGSRETDPIKPNSRHSLWTSDFHTRSNICLYDKTEPFVPFSELKTEYKREYGRAVVDTTWRPEIKRRPTSLKLEGSMVQSTEQQSEYHEYTTNETQG